MGGVWGGNGSEARDRGGACGRAVASTSTAIPAPHPPIAAPALAAAQSLPAPPFPPENPITEEKRILGKALFWDEQLSSDNTVACGTCHIPSAGGSDPRVDMGSRHPGLNGVYGDSDDRFASAGVRLADSSGNLTPDATFGFSPQVTGRRSPSPTGSSWARWQAPRSVE